MGAFDKIIGYTHIKKEFLQISDTLRNMDVYQSLGVTPPNGLLLHGEPGVGKSLMAGALAEESGRKCFTCRKIRPNSEFVNEIKNTFDEAVQNAPSIVFLDDLDKFANEDNQHPDAEEYVAVQSCIDEVKEYQVFVLATANDISCLPKSLKRAGRFDRIIEVEVPQGKDAEDIIAYYLQRKKFVKDVNVKAIAHILDGRSCAELEVAINEAGLYAGYQRDSEITMEHFMNACLRTLFDFPMVDLGDKPNRTLNQDLDTNYARIVYHEAGHVVVSEVLCPESITIVAVRDTSNGCGGYTNYYNNNNHFPLYWTKSRIIAALGGRAAIEQQFGAVDVGSSEDLNMAFSEVKRLVNFECICGFRLHEDRYFQTSDALVSAQEQITASEVERYFNIAKEIIAKNRPFFNGVASALYEKSVLSMVDIAEIKKRYKIVPVPI